MSAYNKTNNSNLVKDYEKNNSIVNSVIAKLQNLDVTISTYQLDPIQQYQRRNGTSYKKK